MTGTWILLATVVAAVLAGGLLRARDGRVRRRAPTLDSPDKAGTARAAEEVPETTDDTDRSTGSPGSPGARLPASVAGALADDGITLVQISTTFCAPCRHTRATLTALAGSTPGLRHVDLDVTDRPRVAESLGILRTPTTIAYTADGEELLRVSGVPKLDRLRPALHPLIEAHTRVPRTEHGSRTEAD